MDLLQDLAQLTLKICPAGYGETQLKAEIDEGWAQLDLRCRNPAGHECVSPLEGGVRGDLYDILDAIRTEMAKVSGQKFAKCAFVLAANGTFNFNVEYETPK